MSDFDFDDDNTVASTPAPVPKLPVVEANHDDDGFDVSPVSQVAVAVAPSSKPVLIEAPVVLAPDTEAKVVEQSAPSSASAPKTAKTKLIAGGVVALLLAGGAYWWMNKPASEAFVPIVVNMHAVPAQTDPAPARTVVASAPAVAEPVVVAASASAPVATPVVVPVTAPTPAPVVPKTVAKPVAKATHTRDSLCAGLSAEECKGLKLLMKGK